MKIQSSHQHVLVTGASSGIGLAIAQAWSAIGANVIGLDRKAPVEGLDGLEVDLTDVAALQKGIRDAAEHLGNRIDVLVNCAGIMIEETLQD